MKNQLCTPDFTITYNVSSKFRGTNYVYFVNDYLEEKYGTCSIIQLFQTVMLQSLQCVQPHEYYSAYTPHTTLRILQYKNAMWLHMDMR